VDIPRLVCGVVGSRRGGNQRTTFGRTYSNTRSAHRIARGGTGSPTAARTGGSSSAEITGPTSGANGPGVRLRAISIVRVH
jgi:hypothetical protein